MTREAGQSAGGTDLPVGEDDTTAVLKAVGRLVKLWRERDGMTQADLGSAIGYSVEQVSSVERGRRVPKAEFLDRADEALGAGGVIAGMQQDVAQARYPKKVRDLAKLEAETVELGAYANHNLHGLLQTEEYTRALFEMRRPTYSEEEIEQQVAARMARQEIIRRCPAPMLSFVQEEVTLYRPIGGRAALRQQLEHLLEVGRLRHVNIQVMPTEREEHAGMSGPFQLLRLKDGTTVGHTEMQLTNRLVTSAREVQTLEMRYGIIRAQALTPRESLAFIEKVWGER
ncbi:helix-turn-helix domain-containing protein [Streptomyces oceani]|uniref:DNA-binding protein n=1 Tax=Streptomyces oceani TaxID=1075402 RepID=A0A1E7KH24_9ACTN|nr:helix-turn-helix transcriptional regulator [Streptomyces oceani]OEV03144.1 DNA-binding protein [Streptomyces oceani]